MLIHMDGFDVYGTANQLWMSGYYTFTNITDSAIANGVGIGTTSGRFGQGAVIFNQYYSMLLKSFQQPLTEIWTGFAINTQGPQGSAAPNVVMSFLSNVGYEAQLTYLASASAWAMWPGNAMTMNPYPTQIAIGNYSIGTNAWHWLEVHYKVGTTNGIAELWIDGVQIFNQANTNTSYNSVTEFYSIEIGSPQGANASPPYMYIDDWYVIDTTTGGSNTRIGDSRIETLVPTSDAGPNMGTPSVAGPHYAMVNESQNNQGTTFVSLPGVPGTEEVYGMSSLSTIPANIWGVRVLNIVEKDDGGVTNGNAVIRSGTTTAYGANQQILSSFFSQFGIFENDPNTNSEWTYNSVNAAKAGFAIS